MLWTAVESSTTWLPGFQLDMIPVNLADKVRFVVKGNASGIEIGNVVGTVILTNGDTLHIKAKVGEINFFRMLIVCEGLHSELKNEINDFASYQESKDTSFSKIVARRFLYELHHILKASPRFKRTKAIQQRQFSEGRILSIKTAINIRKRTAYPIVSEIRLRDFNTPENRVLAAAAQLALSYVDTSNENPNTVSARYWIARFKSSAFLKKDLEEVNRNLRQGKYAGARGYYVKTLALAKIILGQSGFAQGNFEEIYGDAVLINSATLFEEYIRTVIAKKYHPMGLGVRKGGRTAEYLYSDGSYRLIPDICIFRGVQHIFVGDVKYKSPDSKDHYQMHCYMQAYGLNTGVMFAPAFSSEEPEISSRTTREGLKVFEIYLPLSNLDATEKTLGQIHQIVGFQKQ